MRTPLSSALAEAATYFRLSRPSDEESKPLLLCEAACETSAFRRGPSTYAFTSASPGSFDIASLKAGSSASGPLPATAWVIEAWLSESAYQPSTSR